MIEGRAIETVRITFNDGSEEEFDIEPGKIYPVRLTYTRTVEVKR